MHLPGSQAGLMGDSRKCESLAKGIEVMTAETRGELWVLTCTLLVTCAVEHVGYVVGGHGLGVELSAGQSDGDVLQGA